MLYYIINMHYIEFSQLKELDEMQIVNHFPGTHHIKYLYLYLY